MNILVSIFDYTFNSLILLSIAFGILSVIVYLFLMKIKEEKIQLPITFGAGALFTGASYLIFGANLTGSILQTFGAVLIIMTPVILFKGYMQKKDIIPVVFLVSVIYPCYFQSVQFMCNGYYPDYLAVLGDIVGLLFLSLSAMGLLIFIRRVSDSQKSKKVFVFLLIFLIPAIILSSWSVAAASIAVLVFLSLNELKSEFQKCVDIFIPGVLIAAAVIFALPWQYLREMPCILNYFPIWIIPVVSVSAALGGTVYAFRPVIPEKNVEIVIFSIVFVVSAVLYGSF